MTALSRPATVAIAVQRALEEHVNPARRAFLEGGYASSGLRILGVAVPDLRGVVRRFRNETLPAAIIDTLCALALSSPTKSDLQQRDILIVEDPAIRARLNELVDQDWLPTCPHFLVFLGNNRRQRQIHEWRDKPFAIDTSSYGSLYFTVTGFHMAHVIGGLLMIAPLMLWTALGKFDSRRRDPVSNGAIYWHFVDAVWLTVFFTFYVTPYLFH